LSISFSTIIALKKFAPLGENTIAVVSIVFYEKLKYCSGCFNRVL